MLRATNLCTLSVRCGWIWCSALMWKLQELTTLATWLSMVKHWCKFTPKSLSSGEAKVLKGVATRWGLGKGVPMGVGGCASIKIFEFYFRICALWCIWMATAPQKHEWIRPSWGDQTASTLLSLPEQNQTSLLHSVQWLSCYAASSFKTVTPNVSKFSEIAL